MKIACSDCGALYPGNLKSLWGKTEETNGYGAQLRCTALVPGDGPDAANGEKPSMVCGGLLGAVAEAEAKGKVRALTLNGTVI